MAQVSYIKCSESLSLFDGKDGRGGLKIISLPAPPHNRIYTYIHTYIGVMGLRTLYLRFF